MNKIPFKISKTWILFLLLAAMTSTTVTAQLNPLAGIYFQNEYLGNPALAGKEAGLNLNIGYRRQWSAKPGAPKTQ